MVDLKEEASTWTAYARERVAPELVALQDLTGSAAVRFAPPRAQPSFVDRSQVLFDATLVIDPGGIIRLFLLPDTAHFDPKFGGVRRELDRWVGAKAEAPEGDVLPPEKVVSLSGDASPDEVVVRMQIAPGYHVMSNHPADEFAIPTRVRTTAQSLGCEIGEPVFPSPVVVDFYGKHLSTFEGALAVKVPIKCAAPQAKGVSVEVRYQACTASRCLAPVKKTVEVAAP